MTTRRYRPDPDAIVSISRGMDRVDHIVRHLRATGCTCAEVGLTFDPGEPVGVVHVTHDPGCPVLAQCARDGN